MFVKQLYSHNYNVTLFKIIMYFRIKLQLKEKIELRIFKKNNQLFYMGRYKLQLIHQTCIKLVFIL